MSDTFGAVGRRYLFGLIPIERSLLMAFSEQEMNEYSDECKHKWLVRYRWFDWYDYKRELPQ